MLWSLLLCFFPLVGYTQFVSLNNSTGFWEDTNTWTSNRYPGISILQADIDCYGYVTSLHCIDINLGTLYIHDTLIINGNLDLLNSSSLVVDTGAVLFVYGDFNQKNKTDVLNAGTIMIAGGFNIVGSANVGSFVNNGELYVFDSTPKIPDGENYSDLLCPVWSNKKYCIDNYADFTSSPLYNFYESLVYSQRIISTEINECFSAELILSENEICINDSVEISVLTTGINPNDSVVWFFGQNSIPEKAYGLGPHNIKYTDPGYKSVRINIGTDSVNNLFYQDIIYVEQTPYTGDIFLQYAEESIPGPYLDEMCENTFRQYAVSNDENAQYKWKIPALGLDTLSNNTISVDWNVVSGEHLITVQKISSQGCIGTLTEGIVWIKECNIYKEKNISEKLTYAFTPNDDGINDTWEIDNIDNYPLARIYVYNRDGKLLYSSEREYQNDWNGVTKGSKLPSNSYYFIIDLSAYNEDMIKGIVTILR